MAIYAYNFGIYQVEFFKFDSFKEEEEEIIFSASSFNKERTFRMLKL